MMKRTEAAARTVVKAKPEKAVEQLELNVWFDVDMDEDLSASVKAKAQALYDVIEETKAMVKAANAELDDLASAKMRSEGTIGKTHYVHFNVNKFGYLGLIVNDMLAEKPKGKRKSSGIKI